MSATEVFDLLNKGGIIAFLVLVLVGGVRQWWVFGWLYKNLREDFAKLESDRDRWRDAATAGTNLATRSADVVEQAAQTVTRRLEIERAAAEILARERAAGGAPEAKG